MQRRSLVGLLGAELATWAWHDSARAGTAGELFRITRSKNRNVVVYRARARGAELDTRQPLEAYWLMLAEDGRREELSWAERQLAYGFSVDDVKPERCVLRLTAFNQRSLLIARRGQRFGASVSIAGAPAWLDHIYVRTSESGILPKVLYVELFGQSAGGAALRERITSG